MKILLLIFSDSPEAGFRNMEEAVRLPGVKKEVMDGQWSRQY